MKLIAIIMIALFALSACATATLPTGATPAEKAAAQCRDAQLGIAIAETVLLQPQTAEAKTYWDRYLAGARLALATYCMM
jgi:hypothetical protein